jgi:hypothetical protein
MGAEYDAEVDAKLASARQQVSSSSELARDVSNAVALLTQSTAQVSQVYTRLLMDSENRAAQLAQALVLSEESAMKWRKTHDANEQSFKAMVVVRDLSVKMLEEEQAKHEKTKAKLRLLTATGEKLDAIAKELGYERDRSLAGDGSPLIPEPDAQFRQRVCESEELPF